MDNQAFQKAMHILQQEFGWDWQSIVQTLGTADLRKRVGKDLTSFMAFPDRGEGGNNHWRGNCSPDVIASALNYVLENKRYYGKNTNSFTLLDPMSGLDTSKAVADRYHVRSLLYDLNPAPAAGRGNWNALKNDVDCVPQLLPAELCRCIKRRRKNNVTAERIIDCIFKLCVWFTRFRKTGSYA